jgi:hypothetical protein
MKTKYFCPPLTFTSSYNFLSRMILRLILFWRLVFFPCLKYTSDFDNQGPLGDAKSRWKENT